MLGIQASLDDGRVQAVLKELNESMNATMRNQLLRKVAAIYLNSVEKRFVYQNEPTGARWTKSRASTVKRKLREGSAAGVLHIGVFKGKLATSFKYRIEGDTVIISTDKIYAKTFQFGARKGAFRSSPPVPWDNIPPRPFLGVNKKANSDVLEMMNKFFSTKILK